MTSPADTEHIPREKKTRRRLRLSCVECTKRRQRCDRNYPCGLCTSRGVSHLCRWETVPVSRPAPARPPDHAGSRTSAENETIIKELSERIAVLERSLDQQNAATNGHFSAVERVHLRSSSTGSINRRSPSAYMSDLSPGGLGTSIHSSYSSPEPYTQDDDEDLLPLALSKEVYESAHELMQQAVGHRGEYLGNRSAWGLLRAGLPDESTTPKVTQLSLSNITTIWDESHPHPYPSSVSTDQLTERLPASGILSLVLSSFFAEVNWNFGLPEHWLYTAVIRMWNTLRYPDMSGSRINASWLALVFSIIACTPRLDTQLKKSNLETNEQYFAYALAALRIAEESYRHRSASSYSSATDGAILGCLSVPLLISYQSKNDRLSDAWKLTGTWIRIAQAVGLHCDPAVVGGRGMQEEDKCLRILAWSNLIKWDQFLSMILGRPQMVAAEAPDFIAPMLSHPDGAANFFSIYHTSIIQLATIAGEINVKCANARSPSTKTVYDLDEALEQWKTQLPYEYRIQAGDQLDLNIPSLNSTINFRQRYTLSTWYLYTRMKLHLGFLTGEKEGVSYFPPCPPYMSRKQSRATCINLCLDILRLQCELHQLLTRCKTEASAELNLTQYFHWDVVAPVVLFEAAVALVALVSRKHPHDRPQNAEDLLTRTIHMFTTVAHSADATCGHLAETAATILSALLRDTSVRAGTKQSYSREPSPQSQLSQHGSRTNSELLNYEGNTEAHWIPSGSSAKYDWYSNLNTISAPTISIYANTHSPERDMQQQHVQF